MEDPVLVCCATVEWLNSQGLTMKKIQYKTAMVKMLRNDIREMFLEISQEKQTTTKLKMKDVNVFKKFMNEGKASIKFNSEKCNVFFSNAPPGSLIFFLKTLFIKLTKDNAANKNLTEEQMHKKLREHLLSGATSQFDEISPVTNQELDRAKRAAISKSTLTTPSPPANKKRRLIDVKSSDNPRAAKQLYAPSPLSIKTNNNSERPARPDDRAMMENLNEEQDQILKGKFLNSDKKLLIPFVLIVYYRSLP